MENTMSQARIWNRFAKSYARRPVDDQASYDRKLAMTRALLSPDMTLLEVGCGTGSTALIHAPHVARIDAYDFSSEMIALAQAKADEAGVNNVAFEVADLAELRPEGAYDMALALSLLHLLPDATAGLRQLAAHVRPGGHVISSTVCIGDMPGLLARVLPKLGFTGLIPKVLPLTRDALIAAHTAAGLTITDEFRPAPDKAVFLIARKPGQTPA